MRSNVIFLALLVILSTVPIIFLSTNVSANYSTAQGIYSYYSLSLTEVKSPLGIGLVHLTIANSTGTFSATKSASVKAVTDVYDYTLLESGIKELNGTITVELSGNTLVVTSTMPYLAEVLVNTTGTAYIAWAGLTTGKATIKADVYVNGTATVTLYFINGTSLYPVKLQVEEGGKVTETVSLKLYELTVSKLSVSASSEVIVVNEPRRYSPFFANFTFNGTAYMNSEGFAVTKAYWNGTLLPALEWRLNGEVFQHTTISFYGVNGTLVGYVTAYYLNLNASLMGVKHRSEVSVLIIVKVSNAYLKPQYYGSTFVNGNKVEIFVGENGTVMSTGIVTFSHNVSVAGKAGVFLWVEVNGTAKSVFVNKENETVNVTVVAPIAVNSTVVQYAGAYHRAEVVKVENVSGYMSFNVTVNGTVIAVLKVLPNGSKVALNSSSYFVANGRLYVVDDPEETYMVVYSSTVPTQTSTTTSSTPTMSTVSTSTQSTTPTSPPQSTSAPPVTTVITSNTLGLAIVAIVVLLIIIGVGVALTRRRK